MRRLMLPLVALAFIAACGGDGGGDSSGDSGSGVSRDAQLRQAVEETFQAFLDADADTLYANFSSDFQERCDKEDFDRLIGIAALFIGELDATIEVIDTNIDGDRATVTVQVESDEAGVEVSDGGEDDFLHNWVYEDGAWKTETDEPDPCDAGSLFGPGDDSSDDDDEAEPAGPGASRDDAVSVGDVVTTGGIEVTVTESDTDAGERVAELNEFAADLRPGNRFVLLRVHVKHIGGDGEETKQISSSDFKLTGSRNVLYDTFDEASSCGFLDDEISGEMFPGGELEGWVCFQAPADETDLILVVEPFFSFDDENRRYIALD